MANSDPMRSRADDSASHDRRTKRAVLAFLLDEHPARVTGDELIAAFNAKDYAEKDEIRLAVAELVGAGLLRVDGKLIGPTRAAIHFDALERD